MGPVLAASSIVATAVLGALFGRRDRGADRGEVTDRPAALADLVSPEPTPDAEDPTTEGEPIAPARVLDDHDAGRAGGGLKPVPHPIRPWELWHPEPESPRLHHHAPEEQVSWQEIADEDDSAASDDVWEERRPVDGDVLFRDLVDPDRIITSEQVPERRGDAPGGSEGQLINGPVRRRGGGDPDRTRRRLTVGLRLVEGGKQTTDP